VVRYLNSKVSNVSLNYVNKYSNGVQLIEKENRYDSKIMFASFCCKMLPQHQDHAVVTQHNKIKKKVLKFLQFPNKNANSVVFERFFRCSKGQGSDKL